MGSAPTSGTDPGGRTGVRKTLKLAINGAFPRSESGRSYVVETHDGTFLSHAALASRKDVRDAVVAARAALERWSQATAYNRGQVLYRVAEMLEDRRAQFESLVADSEGGEPGPVVDAAIDRVVWYAGWTDKLAQVAGSSNPVAGPYFNFSLPEPTGVIGILAPRDSSLLGLVSVLLPALVPGNTAVVVASEERPAPAVALGEVLATADVPAGVVNLLTGRVAELAPVLASHRDVEGLDLAGAPAGLVAEFERAAAGNVKRVTGGGHGDVDWSVPPGVGRLLAFVETKTVWHPVGI